MWADKEEGRKESLQDCGGVRKKSQLRELTARGESREV